MIITIIMIIIMALKLVLMIMKYTDQLPGR